jgi:outer membrane lipoprotein-sorting protein
MKKIVSYLLLVLLGLTLTVPAIAQVEVAPAQQMAQKRANRSAKKYRKQQRKEQKKELKSQKKSVRTWKKQHQAGN